MGAVYTLSGYLGSTSFVLSQILPFHLLSPNPSGCSGQTSNHWTDFCHFLIHPPPSELSSDPGALPVKYPGSNNCRCYDPGQARVPSWLDAYRSLLTGLPDSIFAPWGLERKPKSSCGPTGLAWSDPTPQPAALLRFFGHTLSFMLMTYYISVYGPPLPARIWGPWGRGLLPHLFFDVS